MTRVLVVKMTSMGDVLHLLPALKDLAEHVDDLHVDWMVEESFSEIPAWHPLVDKVIPVATRRWRRWSFENYYDFMAFLKNVRQQRYDYIFDAQGLMKSALFSRFARLNKGGIRVGFAGDSIKESPAAWLYNKTVSVEREEHAVERLRQLICGGFDKPTPQLKRGYDVDAKLRLGVEQAYEKPPQAPILNVPENAVFLFHGTTWATKHLPETLWYEIANEVVSEGYVPVLAWASDSEHARAQRIAMQVSQAVVLPRSSLTQLAQALLSAQGAIAVDTGLGHLAAALSIPCVSLYGATDPVLTGTYGMYQTHLQTEIACSPCLAKLCSELKTGEVDPPCYATIAPKTALRSLLQQISARKDALGV